MASRAHRVLAGTALAVTGTALLPGCSVYDDITRSDFAGQSAEKIAAAGEEAMSGVDTVRITGSVWLRGRSYFVDMRSSRAGDCTGTLSMEGRHLDLRRVDGESWIKGDSGFINLAVGGRGLPAARVETLTRTWIVMDDRAAREVCDLDDLFGDFGLFSQKKGAEVAVTRGDETDLDDQDAVELTASPGGIATERVWVASEEPHHVLKITREGGREPVNLALSEYDQELEVRAPRPRDVVRP